MPDDWDAILFDLDGTLADSIRLILRCYRHTMLVHLGFEPPDELWQRGIGTPLDEQLAGFARSDGERLAMRETYRAFQDTIHDRLVRPYPGVVEGIAALTNRALPLAVVTSKGRAMAERTLRVCGLGGHFDAIITADDVTNGKPHPEPVLNALERLGRSRPDRVLFVGDAPMDVEAGQTAGVRTAAVAWGAFSLDSLLPLHPDYVFNAFDEVLGIRPARAA
jgi:pyrophosphatase PpaX